MVAPHLRCDVGPGWLPASLRASRACNEKSRHETPCNEKSGRPTAQGAALA